MRLILLAFCLAVAACSTSKPVTSQGYDPALAQRLGADERGMRSYVLVILKTGSYTPRSDEERTELFNGHFANIQRLSDQGQLLLAGPLGENASRYRGIFVFNVPTIAEAEALLAADPTVAAGVFAYEAYEWYGSAALMEAPEIHRRIARPRD
jgi:uncharacterized protein YciI